MARKISYREAINEALAQEMERDERVIVMGEDNAGGAGLAGRARTPGAASSASPRGSTAGSPAGCWTRRSPSRRSSARPIGAATRGDAAGGRADVHRLHGRLLRPDLQPGRQVPVHVRRQGGDAGGDPHDVRRRPAGGRPALPGAVPGLHPHPGAEGGRAVDAVRRQGPADPGDPRRRSGDLLRAQGAVRHHRRRAGGELHDPVRRGEHRARRRRRDRSSRSAGWCTIALEAADELAASGVAVRGDRPAHHQPARHRHDPRERREHRPPRRRRRVARRGATWPPTSRRSSPSRRSARCRRRSRWSRRRTRRCRSATPSRTSTSRTPSAWSTPSSP